MQVFLRVSVGGGEEETNNILLFWQPRRTHGIYWPNNRNKMQIFIKVRLNPIPGGLSGRLNETGEGGGGDSTPSVS